jgi:hypothetical protein
MLDKSTAVANVVRRFRTMDSGDALELLTWKRDRSLLLVKRSEDEILIQERGYEIKDHRVSLSKLKKILKILLKREFPRSHKIRLRSISQLQIDDK